MKTYFLTSKVRIKACGSRRRRGKGDWERSSHCKRWGERGRGSEHFLVITPCSPDGSAVKSLPVIQETWVQSLGHEDHLEKEMATHSNILFWRIPWMEGLAGYSPWGHKELNTTEPRTLSFITALEVFWGVKGPSTMLGSPVLVSWSWAAKTYGFENQ